MTSHPFKKVSNYFGVNYLLLEQVVFNFLNTYILAVVELIRSKIPGKSTAFKATVLMTKIRTPNYEIYRQNDESRFAARYWTAELLRNKK